MAQFSSRPGGSLERWLRRLDRAAEQINPLLMMFAIGLAVLDAACVIALIDVGSLALHRGPP
ncbi:MAG: hypothetical protein JO081_12950 [Alphaproteobacteria bacterium]|nr:hypothetical protein [Alphaproteobacteria bacterium]